MRAKKETYTANLDLLGMTVSIACAIHCAMLPILVTLGTLGTLSFLTSSINKYTEVFRGNVFLVHFSAV